MLLQAHNLCYIQQSTHCRRNEGEECVQTTAYFLSMHNNIHRYKCQLRLNYNLVLITVVSNSLAAVVKCQVQCFDGCGLSAVTLSLPNSAAICCASGGSAFIDLLDESAGCQLCSDLEGNHHHTLRKELQRT